MTSRHFKYSSPFIWHGFPHFCLPYVSSWLDLVYAWLAGLPQKTKLCSSHCFQLQVSFPRSVDWMHVLKVSPLQMCSFFPLWLRGIQMCSFFPLWLRGIFVGKYFEAIANIHFSLNFHWRISIWQIFIIGYLLYKRLQRCYVDSNIVVFAFKDKHNNSNLNKYI
jgi:TM2 domain-containing membrane protein YozV